MAQVYDARKIKVYIDGKEIKGFSPDSKVTITPAGEGSNRQVGTDGEVVFSIDVDNTFDIQLSLLQSSKSNDYLSNMYKNMQSNTTVLASLLCENFNHFLIFVDLYQK